MIAKRSIVVVSTLLFTACAGRTGLGAIVDGDASAPSDASHDAWTDSPVVTNANGVWLNSCGPTDGPALTLLVGSPAPTCASPLTNGPSIAITMTESLTQGPGALDVGPGLGAEAVRCVGGNGPCETGGHGTLQLDVYSPTGATVTGSIALTFGSGQVTQSFTVTQCHNPATCG